MGTGAGGTKSGMSWMTLLAFGIIYFVWGSTFLAIRVGVHEVPPLVFAALRFMVAGAVLFGYTVVRGEKLTNGRQWMGVSLLALLIFVGDYGLLFWAEQRVPSGIAAVMMATIPVFTALADIMILQTQRMTVRLAAALVIGLVGVGALTLHSLSALNLGTAAIDGRGAAMLLVASLNWSLAAALSRKAPLPASKVMSSGAQMLAGGVLLTVCALGMGEFREFHPESVSRAAWFALIYLILAGSILGFTAYVWLIHHQTPTKVGTYAYVNPLVAVVVGYFLGGEEIGVRTVVGTACILVSVVVITTAKPPAVRPTTLGEEG